MKDINSQILTPEFKEITFIANVFNFFHFTTLKIYNFRAALRGNQRNVEKIDLLSFLAGN